MPVENRVFLLAWPAAPTKENVKILREWSVYKLA